MSARLVAVAVGIGFCAAAGNIAATEAHKRGAELYRSECAKCHGKVGEGVKGKYDDALHGDWSIEKLTRIIERTMPEDDPDRINGAEVAEVARYVYDTFYSREARAKKNPPRIELVRLTNRQYVHTVADLIKHFTAVDGPVGTERGLRGTYYDKRFEKKVTERRDLTVNFDFGTNAPGTNGYGTNGFSMRWHGSVMAEESGDYEFIMRTPNGARLWVNDEGEPLIDASVASGEATEHKATRRLLGGRVYPLRLEVHRAPKDKRASIALEWKPPHGVQEVIPARCLTPSGKSPTFVVTTPFPPDDSSVGYERGVSVSKAWDEATTQAAIQVANHVVKNLDRFAKTKADATNRAAKVEQFSAEFVAKAFRRPLTETEKRVYVAAHFQGASSVEEAARRVVLLALKSPHFLYLGLNSAKPDEHEVAARLSFGLWDSLPDAELAKAAAQGDLRTREQVAAHAQRMIHDPRARAKMQYFLHHWVGMNHIEDLAKDGKIYPGFTPEVIADLRTSLDLFLNDVVWSEGADWRRLLLEDGIWVNNRIAKFYGVETNATEEFVKAKVSDGKRSGVLTHPYLLAAFSYPKYTSPIHRGVFLTRNIVGRALKPPPVAVAFKEDEFPENLTMRQKIEQLTRPQACQTCHSVINPLGFTLEHFDAVGRFRTMDGDKPVDAAGDYMTDDGKVVRLKEARDVAEFAIGSEHAQDSFVEQLFHMVVKQPVLAYGADTQEQLRKAWVASGFNIQKLLVEIATASALHGVKPATKLTAQSGR